MSDLADLPSSPNALEFVRLALRGDLTIVDLLDNLEVYRTGADWTPWRAFLCALYGLPMTPAEITFYTAASGRKIPPKAKAREAWVPAGRRARKALAIDTPIPTPSGWSTMGDLRVGDEVFDELGKPTKVIAVTDVMFGRPCYELTFSDGDKVVADEGHLWRVYGRPGRRENRERAPTSILLETFEISKAPIRGWAKESKYSIAINEALQLPDVNLPIDPYVLGVWLGDGHSVAGRVTTADEEILEQIRLSGETVSSPYCNGSKATTWAIGVGPRGGTLEEKSKSFTGRLRVLGVLGNKHIPSVYLRASTAQRLALLQGMMDTDGSCNERGQPVFWNTNKRLANEFLELARSLSFKATITNKKATLYGKDCGICYSVRLSTRGSLGLPPFRLPRKLERADVAGNPHLRWKQIRACVPVPSVPVRCIQVDNPRGMFLAGRGFTATHNSAIAGLVAVWEGALRSHKHALAPGERGRVLIMSESLARATVVFNYAKTLLTQTQLKCLLGGTPNTERIPLWNNIDIEIAPARRVAAIARTTVCAIFDEIAFFPTDEEYANPDEVILQAIRPSMATVDKPLILGVSSPYARRGLLWKNYSEHYGREDSSTLVWQAASDIMNPHPGVIAEMRSEYEKDPISASAEFGAQFRSDIEQYLDLEMLAACTSPRGELPVPRDDKGNILFPERRYFAYVDPAGGGSDQFALAIAHYDSGASRGVLDLIRAWTKPLSTDAIVARCADILRDYSITRVTGDKYAGDWPKDAFATHGISYIKADLNRSEMYLEFIPLVRSRVVDLPDRLPVEGAGDLAHKMRMQFTALDRTTTALSKERVDHPRGKHDDVCQVVAGVMVYTVPRMRRVREEPTPEEDPLWPMKRAKALMFDFSRYTSPKQAMNPYGTFHGGRKP